MNLYDFWKKFLGDGIVKALFYMLGVAGAALFTVYTPEITWPTAALTIACLAVAAAAGLGTWLTIRHFPNFKWDIKHTENRYVMAFESRELIEYAREICAILCVDGIKGLPGEYRWTGSHSDAMLVNKDDLKLILSKKGNPTDPQQYIIGLENTEPRNSLVKYTLKVMAHDDNHEMLTQNAIYIIRPTKQITLELHLPNSVKIRNVRFRAWTEFGDQGRFVDKEAKPAIHGGCQINTTSYEYVVKNPKLFCIYAITWDWY